MISSWPIPQATRGRTTTRWHALVALLLTIMLLQLVPAAPPAPVRSIVADSPAPTTDTSLPATPAAPPYALPAELAGKQELADRRSAYSATFDMGGGSYALLADSAPIHYQDDQGAWQPINPAFAAVENGWLNRTNTVQAGLSARTSSAKIGDKSVGVGWQPSALVVAGPGGEAEVARPLPEDRTAPGQRSADGRTVRYLASWSDPQIQDQWQARRGASEYAMRLPALPRAGLASPQSLDLRVELHLRPGTSIVVSGRPAALPLETREQIAFVGEQGQQLLLAPPRAYEQGQPDTTIPGSYALAATADSSVVELRVRTPWAWLAAPERQFPVIIDPVFQMRSATTVFSRLYDKNFAKSQGETEPLDLGRFNNGQALMFLKFELPTMPLASFTTGQAGTTIESATLIATPTGHNIHPSPYLRANVLAFRLGDSSWIDNELAIHYDSSHPLPPGAQTMSYSQGDREHPGSVSWDVTELVRGWYSGFGPNNANNGLLLTTPNPFCDFDPDGCGGFYFKEEQTWIDDELNQIERNAPMIPASTSGGVRLLVHYTGPALKEFAKDANGNPINAVVADPPSSGAEYYHADHDYQVPPLPNHWQALVARGLGEETDLPDPVPADEPSTHPIEQKVRGSVNLRLRDAADKDDIMGPVTASEDRGEHVTYLMLNGNHKAGVATRLRVMPGYGRPNSYDLRLLNPAATIDVRGQQTVVTTYQFDSGDPMALWQIALDPDSNSRVDIILKGDNLNLTNLQDDHFYNNVRKFRASMMPNLPAGFAAPGVKKPNIADGDVARDQPIYMTAGPFNPASDNYALALAYDGSRLEAYSCEPPATTLRQPPRENVDEFPSCSPKIVRYMFKMDVRVTSCKPDADGNSTMPTPDGGCQVVKCPTLQSFPIDDPQNRYRTGGALGLWSESGWEPANGGFAAGKGVAPLIGAADRSVPHVMVVGGRLIVSGASVSIDSNNGPPTVLLVNCGSLEQPNNPLTAENYFPVFNDPMRDSGDTLIPAVPPSSNEFYDVWGSPSDRLNPTASIIPGPGTGQLKIATILTLHAGHGDEVGTLSFPASWAVDYRGWPSLAGTVTPPAEQAPPVASMALDLLSDFAFDIGPIDPPPLPLRPLPEQKDAPRMFTAIRVGQARVTQRPGLGGASAPVQALILPRGAWIKNPPERPLACRASDETPTSCIDLRAPDDTPEYPNRRWIMPDVHTNFPAGMVMLSQRGALQVYSVDHPGANAASFTQPFSFDTFSGAVTVALEKCDANGSGHEVVVVRGETQMTLPNIGDSSNPDSLIQASFKLCETSLRSVHMEFHSPGGVPIGSSGLSLTGLSGAVDIYDDHTTITFGLDFQTTDGGLLTGHGDVTIDTRGLFAFQGNAKILGAVDADGKLWVAWNPLDMGFEMNLSYGGWLSGFARAHLWKGQGWQHRYAWLPDNGETHIAAQFGAQIRITKGKAFSWTFIDIPPFTTTFSIEIAFGQFCTSGDCTHYEWGVKGKFSVAGYDVGLYFGFSHGFDFILGNDDHTLIDQFGGASSAPVVAANSPLIIAQAGPSSGAPRLAQVADGDAPLEIRSGAPIENGLATERVDVHADAQQLLFGVGWRTGAPSIRLLNPHGDVAAAWSGGQISGNIAYSYAITQAFELDRNMALIGLKRPADTTANPWQGGWKIEIGNLHDDRREEYRVIMFANQGAPGGVVANGGYAFTAPVSQLEAATGSYTIRWDVPQGTPDSTRISLYYSQTPPTSTPIPDPAPGDPDDPNLPHGSIPVQQDIPIVRHVRFADGEYAWDTRALASGSYLVYGVVDDGFNSFPANDAQLTQPNNPCIVPSSGLPTTRAFRPDRFPGTVVFTSTGTIVISDTTPPAAPTGLSLTPADGALLARWDRPPAGELDTVAYVVHWHQDRPGQSPIDNQQRVTAVETPTLRLGGLTNGQSASVSLQAIDASENISAPSPEITAVPEGVSAPIPLAPTDFHVLSVTADSASFAWTASEGAASYRLVYTEVTTQPVTAQIEAPGDATSATIGGLRAGMTYQVRLSAANSAGWRSASTDAVSVVATSGVSSASDGLPDDWAAFYQVVGAGADPDADGLSNLQEFTRGTNPTSQDSDGDGFSDYEELHGQPPTNPFDRTNYGASVLQPRLDLERNQLSFLVDLTATTPVTPEMVGWSNSGGGNLVITATTDSAWLSAQVVSNTIRVGLNRALLKPGFNAGIVRLAAAPGSDPLVGTPSCIRVRVWATGRNVTGPAGGTPCVADTYVERKYPDQSFGSSTKLEADADHEAWAFIRCQIPAGDKVKRVRLRLYVVESAPHGGRFYRVDSDWSEDMTWRTRPTHLGKLIAKLGPVKRGKYVEVDVTKALRANGTISLAIRTPSEEDVEYASREAGANRGPLLIVER